MSIKVSSVHAHCSCSLFTLQTLQEEKERKSECLPPEPHPDDPESVKIIFKLPNDSRVERRFHFTQSLTVSLGQSFYSGKPRVKEVQEILQMAQQSFCSIGLCQMVTFEEP